MLLRGFLLLFLIGSSSLFAQEKELGLQYYRGKEYNKAIENLEKVYKSDRSHEVYNALLKSYQAVKDFKSAVKTAEKQYKTTDKLVYKIDIGHTEELKGSEKKAQKTYEEILNELSPNHDEILDVGNRFFSLKKYKLAEKTFQKGIKLLNKTYAFSFELGEVYAAMGNLSLMSESIVGALNYGPNYLESVQNAISTKLYDDENGKIKNVFIQTTTKFAQKNPNDAQYMELLIWLYLLDNNFAMAFNFSKSLDKRFNENGSRIMKLAKAAKNNQHYDVATDCYQYIISENKENYYYKMAKIELVNVLKEKLEESGYLLEPEIIELKEAYEKAFSELGYSELTAELVINYADLLCFHLNQSQKAINLIDQIIINPRVKSKDKAVAKIKKGDIMVFLNEVWEATLLYGQVSTEYKNDNIGYEAKLQSAKAYYYTGDFDWAKTQLDVLKGATTKLIANNAMVLSILISDNLGMDTTEIPLKMYAEADLYFYQKKYQESIDILEQITKAYPNHLSILDHVYYLQAKIYIQLKKFDKAILYLEKAVDYNDLLADESLLKLGEIHETFLNDNKKAMEYYEQLIVKFPSSVFASKARKRFRVLRGDI